MEKGWNGRGKTILLVLAHKKQKCGAHSVTGEKKGKLIYLYSIYISKNLTKHKMNNKTWTFTNIMLMILKLTNNTYYQIYNPSIKHTGLTYLYCRGHRETTSFIFT